MGSYDANPDLNRLCASPSTPSARPASSLTTLEHHRPCLSPLSTTSLAMHHAQSFLPSAVARSHPSAAGATGARSSNCSKNSMLSIYESALRTAPACSAPPHAPASGGPALDSPSDTGARTHALPTDHSGMRLACHPELPSCPSIPHSHTAGLTLTCWMHACHSSNKEPSGKSACATTAQVPLIQPHSCALPCSQEVGNPGREAAGACLNADDSKPTCSGQDAMSTSWGTQALEPCTRWDSLGDCSTASSLRDLSPCLGQSSTPAAIMEGTCSDMWVTPPTTRLHTHYSEAHDTQAGSSEGKPSQQAPSLHSTCSMPSSFTGSPCPLRSPTASGVPLAALMQWGRHSKGPDTAQVQADVRAWLDGPAWGEVWPHALPCTMPQDIEAQSSLSHKSKLSNVSSGSLAPQRQWVTQCTISHGRARYLAVGSKSMPSRRLDSSPLTPSGSLPSLPVDPFATAATREPASGAFDGGMGTL
jgi:hypothetical protein